MRVAVVLVLAGCNAILGVHGETVGSGGASPDGRPPDDVFGTDGSLCFGSLATHCFTGDEPNLILPPLFDTSTDPRCDPQATSVCIVAGDLVTIGNGSRVRGARPLAIIARDSFTIGGETLLDVGSHDADPGPGANDPACLHLDGSSDAPGTSGGSFGGQGGKGGVVGGMSNPPPTMASGKPDHLRSGCPGGKQVAAPLAAASGGALYVFARNEIRIDGAIDAGGAGGTGGKIEQGGGGGGAGGMIALEAPVIEVSMTGAIQAIGGGGGGGGDPSANGGDGQDGGSGGLGGPPSGTGGQGGSASATTGGDGLPSNFGGGGGAGGPGFILVRGDLLFMGGTVEPTPTVF